MPIGGPKKKGGGQKAKQKKQAAQDKKTKKNAGKDQELSDKTFGIKNKKGAKGAKFIQQTTMALKGGEIHAAKKREAARKAAKEQKKLEAAAAEALFGSMAKTVRDKNGKKLNRNEIAAKKKAEEDKQTELKAKQDLWDNLTLEEKIEHKRAQLDTTKCTPVTPENFVIWKAAKRARKEAAEDARVEALKKQAKGKNKKRGQIITGRELFKLDASLFKDDSNSFGDSDILAMSEPEESGADDSEDDKDRGFLDSDSDEMNTDDENEGEDGDTTTAATAATAAQQKAATKSSASPPAAPPAADGITAVSNVTADLYLNDDGLDDLDDLDDLEDD